MRLVFADTLYWVAIARPNDTWAAAAKTARVQVGNVALLTTDEVLVEFATALSRSGAGVRRAVAAMVRAIRQDPGIRVVEQSRTGFDRGLSRYERRDDKSYSFTDCVSMNVMEQEGITAILTNDHHFTQEGFDVLIRSR